MFDVSLPPGSIVYAVHAEGEYTFYVLHAGTWAQIDEGETWEEYLQRINTTQGMPSATFSPHAAVSDTMLNQVAAAETTGTPIEITHNLCWGYVEGLLVVGFMDEAVFPQADGAGYSVEERTLRTFWAIGYPPTEDEAATLMNSRIVRRISTNSQPGGKFPAADEQEGPEPLPNPFPEVKHAEDMHHLAVDLDLPLAGGGGSEGDGVGDDRGDWNAAGIACLASFNSQSDSCNTSYGNSTVSCETSRWGYYSGAGVICVSLAWWNPPAGLACAGAAMLWDAYDTYHCREDAGDDHDVCMNGARQVLQACCNMPGTDCGLVW